MSLMTLSITFSKVQAFRHAEALLSDLVSTPTSVSTWGMLRRPRPLLASADTNCARATLSSLVIAYFAFRDAIGEWLGSLVGSLLMASTLAAGFGVAHSALKLSAVLFLANSVGYFLGSALNDSFGGTAGMLLWGTAYGLCLGVGLGAVLYQAQQGARQGSLET